MQLHVHQSSSSCRMVMYPRIVLSICLRVALSMLLAILLTVIVAWTLASLDKTWASRATSTRSSISVNGRTYTTNAHVAVGRSRMSLAPYRLNPGDCGNIIAATNGLVDIRTDDTGATWVTSYGYGWPCISLYGTCVSRFDWSKGKDLPLGIRSAWIIKSSNVVGGHNIMPFDNRDVVSLPVGIRYRGFASNVLIFGIPISILLCRRKVRIALSKGRCHNCGYPIVVYNAARQRCPECGKLSDSE